MYTHLFWNRVVGIVNTLLAGLSWVWNPVVSKKFLFSNAVQTIFGAHSASRKWVLGLCSQT